MTDTNRQLPATQQATSLPCAALTLPPLSERLAPVTKGEGTAELMACLTLVAPTGMTADERNEWARVARQTLTGIPADLMRRGAAAARAKCRFPSEIVPAIIAEVEGEWSRRKRLLAEQEAERARRHTPMLAKPDQITPEQAAAVLIELGLKRGPEVQA